MLVQSIWEVLGEREGENDRMSATPCGMLAGLTHLPVGASIVRSKMRPLMRKTLRWLLLGGATVSAVASATAQTYDPRYPVCLQRWVWGGSTYFECNFTSWDQCRAAAAGLPAMCLDNPYWPRGYSRSQTGPR